MTRASPAELRDLFADWLRHDTRPILVATRGHGDPLTIHDLIDGLTGDRTPLPADAARALGLPAGTRTAAAMRLLRWAVEEPDGPRCRTYRSASYFLAGLDTDELPVSAGSTGGSPRFGRLSPGGRTDRARRRPA